VPAAAGNERTFGVLSLFADRADGAGTEEVKLLQEMADNLAFGIGNLRAALESRQLQDAVLKIAAASRPAPAPPSSICSRPAWSRRCRPTAA